ncbi:hypothetical protein [Belnapia sp. F-4-1]|uniref:hypothetical protein n=1 Tax=Belnapia sp. F-4-1 TaxID=1545443 RepID=UPI001186BF19|nr:hypothetical protein [Belnapia sp. F-4-1]
MSGMAIGGLQPGQARRGVVPRGLGECGADEGGYAAAAPGSAGMAGRGVGRPVGRGAGGMGSGAGASSSSMR